MTITVVSHTKSQSDHRATPSRLFLRRACAPLLPGVREGWVAFGFVSVQLARLPYAVGLLLRLAITATVGWLWRLRGG